MTKVDNDIIFYAFRYALGRMTYVVQEVSDYLVNNWEEIEPDTRSQIQQDIKEAMVQGKAGWDIDQKIWQKVLDLPVKEGNE